MGGLFSSKSVSSTAPVISSIQLQTSSYGRAITWVFGKQRVAPNLIQYDDFTAVPHTTTQRTGKGGGSKSSSTDYSYTVAAIMALGSGTLESIGKVWKDKEQTTITDLKLDFYNGDPHQEAYPYFVSKHPERALSYRGIAYVAGGAYDLGSNAQFGNHTFEVQAPGSIAANYPGALIPDAEVVDVVSALLTDIEQGVGLDPATMGDLSSFRNFCLANGLWVSPAYTDQRGAFEYIKNLLTIGFSDCVYSGGRFKIVPYSDVPASSALANYVPTIAPVYQLGEDDFIGDTSTDAIKVSQKSAEESFNHVRVKFSDRANDYNDNIAESSDDADIEQHGLRTMDVVDLKEIADASVAQKVADFILHRSLYILNKYEFRLPWKYVRLEPMDVVTLNYPRKYLDQTPVLVVEINEDDDGLLTIIAEDYPIGSNRASTQPVPNIGNTGPNYAVIAGDATAPLLFEPPGKLTNNDSQLWMATSGGVHWGGCVVWVSTDDLSYQRIGTVRSQAQHGVLAAPLAKGAAIDTAHTLSVDLTISHGELKGGTEENAQDLLTACYVDGEYIAYAHEVLTGANAYNLSYLVRGAFGSTIVDHAQDTPFAFLDNGIFKYSYPREWIGKTIWIKLASFNKFGNSLQDLSTVTAHQYTIVGAKVDQVQFLVTRSKPFSIEIEWGMPPASAGYLGYAELWYGTTSNRANAAKLGSFASPQNTHTITGLAAGVTFYFWVRLVDQSGNVGEFYPAGAGVVGSSSTDAREILDWLAGQISKTQLSIDLLQAIDLINGLESIRDALAAAHLTAMLAANNAAIKETQERAAALLVEATTRGAQITEVKTSVQTATTSLASKIDTVSAANAGTAAAVQNEITARTTATNALASSITTVAASTAANTAAITSEQTARTNTESALATSINTVVASTAANTAAIVSEKTARTTADSALATSITTVVATTAANTAAITSEQTARSTAVSALADWITTVAASTATNTAGVTSEQSARATADGALSTRIDTALASANGATAAVQVTSKALAETNGNLSALHTIKTQVTAAGKTYMAGIGIGVEVNGTTVESQILLSAQRVAVVNEDTGGLTVPFAIQGGQVFINEAFIANASITKAKIGDAQVETLKIGANAVTVPLAQTFYGTTEGNNGASAVATASIYIDQPGMVFAASTGYISYGTGWKNCGTELFINGTSVSAGGGAEAWVNAAHSGGLYCSVGWVTVQLNFNGQPGCRIINPSLFIMGAKR